MFLLRRFYILLLFVFCSCLSVRGEEQDSHNPYGAPPSDSSTTEVEETSTTLDEESSSSSGMPDTKFDVPIDMSTSCKKIDFLFIIDNSGSMSDNQENLIANYQILIDGIIGLTGFDDFHVGVITTDEYSFNAPECSLMGGLVVQTGGTDSSDRVCGPWVEGNYMTFSEIQGEDGFACAAQVGTSGNAVEQPIRALTSSLGPFIRSEDQCNEGFFREDAKLVVVIITDEDDASNGSALNALAEIEFYKQDLENIVVIGLLPSLDGECTNVSGIDIKNFIAHFPYYQIGDVCDEDYGVFLENALGTVEAACKPEG